MACPKCSGLLIREDLRAQSGQFLGWRCIQCGFRMDHLIVKNRTGVRPEGDLPDEDDESPSPANLQAKQSAARGKRAASRT